MKFAKGFIIVLVGFNAFVLLSILTHKDAKSTASIPATESVSASSTTVSEPVAVNPTTEPEPATESTSITEPIDKDEIFLTAVDMTASQEAKDLGDSVSDYKKIKVAKAACEAFDGGATAKDVALVAAIAVDGNMAAAEYVGRVIGAGVVAYCPEHRSKLP